MDVSKKKERYNIINDDEEFEYVITRERYGELFKIRHSKGSIWSSGTRGQHIATLTDNGDNIFVEFGNHNEETQRIKFDYDVFVEIFELMKKKRKYDEKKFKERQNIAG